ncbi:MAG: hypothetical protein PUH24_05415 [Prevotellaceae bacterium]|nr:hypothetical protein [Prevotella sp.]MDD7257700.1 hypothetical protein [Prevotellaceae bacterium]MDY6130741.1 hypothetical protein [Prevotella sp.]
MNKLLDFMKESGLYNIAKIHIPEPVVNIVCLNQSASQSNVSFDLAF